MRRILNDITSRIVTKRGVWIALFIWILVGILLNVIAPNSEDYKVTSVDTLPEKAQSVIADNKLDDYFPDSDGVPALLVLKSNEGPIDIGELAIRLEDLEQENIKGIKEILPLWLLPEEVILTFFSEEQEATL